MKPKKLNFRGNSEKASMRRIAEAEQGRSLACEKLTEPPNAMAMVALQRQILHEKIAHLRALREAAEAGKPEP